MAPVDLPYLIRIRSRGRDYWYFRRHGLRTKLPGAPGEPAFMEAYQRSRTASDAPARPTATAGSLAALIAAYRGSPDWDALKPATRIDYNKALDPLMTRFGHLPVATMPRAFVIKLRDEYARKAVLDKQGKPTLDPDGKATAVATPRRANRMVAVLRLLLSWAVDHGWRRDNPALRPKLLRTGDGYRAWTPAELAQFLAHTGAEMRDAAELAIGTGQRGIDLIAMSWAAYDGTAIEVVQEKTGARTWLPCPARLKTWLDARDRRAVTILTRPDGKPWGLSHFQHQASAAIRAAGLKGVVWHGLRAMAAVQLAEAGASDAELQAVIGWATASMAAKYRRGADQKQRAVAAVEKLDAHRNRQAANASGTPSAKRKRPEV